MMGKLKVRSLKRHQDSNGTVISFIQIQQCFNVSAKMAEARGSDRKQEEAMSHVKRADNLDFTLPKPIQGSSQLTYMKLRYCMDRNHFSNNSAS